MSGAWFETFFDAAANDHWNAALPPSYTTARDAGLTVDALLGDLDGRIYDETADALLLVAHRPA